MQTVMIPAREIKMGDVVDGQRVNSQPIMGLTRPKKKVVVNKCTGHVIKGKVQDEVVHLLLLNRNGYKVELHTAPAEQIVRVKRPLYNMTKAERKAAKESLNKALQAINSLM